MQIESLPYRQATEKLCQISPQAAGRIRFLLRKKGWEQGALKLSIIGGGCAGLQYQMDLVESPRARDLVVEKEGARIAVDAKSALFVSGSTLDFSTDLQKGGFKVTNPNATSHCSCGQSFST